MKKAFGHFCLILAMVFAVCETHHFGNNFFPQTWQEVLCDLVALALTVAGWIIVTERKP